MKIFLDTDIISYFFAGNINIYNKIVEEINSGNQICLTCVNVYELVKGLKYRNNKNIEQKVYEFIKDIIVFPLDNDSVQVAADIYATLKKRGLTIGDADILIASIVITANGKLITNNIKHYKDIEKLPVENWC